MEKIHGSALTLMRRSVQKLGSSSEKYDDPTLMRFLIARSMDSEKAAKMFVQWQKWREALVPEGFVPESEIREQLEARKIYLQGLSKNGYPVMIVKACKHCPSKDLLQFKNSVVSKSMILHFNSFSLNNFAFFIEFVAYLLDKTIASSFNGRETGNEKLIGVIDLQQITLKNVDARALITGFQFLQSYYPERLARCFILNMPRFFVSVWAMVSYFLDKATSEKIVIVSNEDQRRDFIKEIGEEALPEEYGGRASLTAIQDVRLIPLED